jgi:hypothetical protein
VDIRNDLSVYPFLAPRYSPAAQQRGDKDSVHLLAICVLSINDRGYTLF